MSLSTIIDEVESGAAAAAEAVTKGIADLRSVATAIEGNHVVQAALNIADEVAPEVKAAAAALLPELTGVHVSAIEGVVAAIRGVLALAPKAAPPAPPAAA